MHALREYVQHQMDTRGWKQSDLVTASGISKQVISELLKDTRDRIDRMPREETIDGLCRAFRVPRQAVLVVIGKAMGLPVAGMVEVPDASRVHSDELIRELAKRLREAGGPDDQAPNRQAGGSPAADDLATSGSQDMPEPDPAASQPPARSPQESGQDG